MATISLLDSSTLAASSCSSLKPAPGVSSLRSPRRGVRCSCSREEVSSSTTRRSSLSTLVATGLALSISASSGIALASAEPSLINVSNNVAKEADKLLKDADKLINEDSPNRYGPSRGFPGQAADRIAQQGGSGAIPEIQSEGSELVGKARDNILEKAEITKQKLGESIQGKGEEVKKGIEGFFGQAQDKVSSDVGTVKKGSNEPVDKVKGLVGDARSKVKSDINTTKNKVKSDVDTTKDNSEGLIGSIKKGLNIQ